MARINLLPWREELRKERKRQFMVVWCATVLFGIALIFIGDLRINNNISYQKGRNQYLQHQIAQLNEQISEIKDLRTKKEQLLERMRVIQNLQEIALSLSVYLTWSPVWFRKVCILKRSPWRKTTFTCGRCRVQ